MKRMRVLSLALCAALALGAGVPAAWAAQEEAEAVPTTVVTIQPTPAATPAPEAPEETNGAEPPAETPAPTPQPAETPAETPAEEEAPQQTPPAAPACTCGAADGVHAADCPLAAPAPAHLPGCQEGCTGEGCACPCHVEGLFARLLACETLDALDAVLESAAEAELSALTDAQMQAVEAHILALEPSPAPAIVPGGEDSAPVASEILLPTVSFAQVAPFGSPVEGGAQEGDAR